MKKDLDNKDSGYISNMEELRALVEKLRREHGDKHDVEAKSCAGGLSTSLNTTICAMANLPEGGVIILGLNEEDDFKPVVLGDIQVLKKGLVGKARACFPPVKLTFMDQDEAKVEGLDVVVARIEEADRAHKPVRVSDGGKSYLRDWDGDFEMSSLEEQGFQSLRNHPDSDRKPVEGATKDDLDPDLLADYEATVHISDPNGLGRFSGDELLRRAGVITDSAGTPSVAGILALGKHPQQFFPRFGLFLVKLPLPGQSEVRGTNVKTLTGPIPVLLDGALEWAQSNFTTRIVTLPDGSTIDRYEYPLDAFREIIGNALVHRDFAEWSRGDIVEVRLYPDQLVVTNPGGLFGVTMDRIYKPGNKSARNARLIEILKCTHTPTGKRVVETLSSGMPTIANAAAAAGMELPLLKNTGIRFSVIWAGLAPHPIAQTPVALKPAKGKSAAVKNALQVGPKTIPQLMTELGLKRTTVWRHLNTLIAEGAVEQADVVGQSNIYRVTQRIK